MFIQGIDYTQWHIANINLHQHGLQIADQQGL